MQKVEGSSPFIRFKNPPETGVSGLSCLSPTSPLGDAIETFVRREDAERFIEEGCADDPELASYLRIEERELAAEGGIISK